MACGRKRRPVREHHSRRNPRDGRWLRRGHSFGVRGVLGGTRAIRLIVPPTETEDVAVSIAVAAYFEGKAETTPQLRVAGTVLENGKPLPEGRARVTVRRLNDASQQGISVVITNGRFETGDQAAFSGYSRRDRLTVETEVSKPDVALLGRHETYLNAFPPLRPGSIQAVLVGLGITAVVFFWAFTGSATPGKNQGAIIFSYCVMILFLALPFMAFYVLGRYQSVAQAAMDVAWTTPVGVLPAVPVHDSDGRPATGVIASGCSTSEASSSIGRCRRLRQRPRPTSPRQIRPRAGRPARKHHRHRPPRLTAATSSFPTMRLRVAW